jgi:hypothetical protein
MGNVGIKLFKKAKVRAMTELHAFSSWMIVGGEYAICPAGPPFSKKAFM